MNAVLDALALALARPSAPAFAAALAWGVASIILSPCHLGSIPLVVAYVNSGAKPSSARALLLSCAFALGILVTLAALGAVAAGLGTLAGDVGAVPRIVVSVLLVVSGLWLLEVPPLSRISIGIRKGTSARGTGGALLLGLLYGVILGPCSFAFLSPMIGIAFAAGGASWGYGAALMAAFALGHCATIAAAGTAGDRVRFLLERKGLAVAGTWIKRACAAAVIGIGVIQGLRALGVRV